MDTLCKPNFKFLGRTLFEKNAMISCKIQSCTIVLINNFEIFQVSIAFFSYTVRPRKLKFFLYINPYGYSLQTKFHVPRSHTFREKCDVTCKIQSCTILLINNFEILQVSIAFFSNTVRPRNLKFFLYINPYGYSLQTKFHVPRSHTFREKCDDNSMLYNCPNKQL